MSDATWQPSGQGFEPKVGTFYIDRPLTRRERFCVRILRRPDPRYLGTYEYVDGRPVRRLDRRMDV